MAKSVKKAATKKAAPKKAGAKLTLPKFGSTIYGVYTDPEGLEHEVLEWERQQNIPSAGDIVETEDGQQFVVQQRIYREDEVMLTLNII